jgi:hypothetical protein
MARKISPLMKAHLQSLVDRHGREEGSERPSPPKRPRRLPQRPTAAPMRNAAIYVDGQHVCDAPEWSEPSQKQSNISVSPAPAEESEAERQQRIRRQKQAERELVQMRSAARAKARAAAAPPRRPLSEATRNHLLRQLSRPDAELLEG